MLAVLHTWWIYSDNSSTYMMDLQWQQFYIHDGFSHKISTHVMDLQSQKNYPQYICKYKNKSETNSNIMFNIDHDKF